MTIDEMQNEIDAIDHILNDSINLRYGKSNTGKLLSTEEHFRFWDRMWNLMQCLNEIKDNG